MTGEVHRCARDKAREHVEPGPQGSRVQVIVRAVRQAERNVSFPDGDAASVLREEKIDDMFPLR